jgi:hypothetical protein
MRSNRRQDTSNSERVDQRPGLRVDGLYSSAKRADRRKAGDQRANVAEGRNAEPQRLHSPVPDRMPHGYGLGLIYAKAMLGAHASEAGIAA